MKKIVSALAFLFLSLSLFAFTQNDIHIYTLENGLTLYFLQDTTTATVRMELNIKAGTTCQTPETAGLFSLCARLQGLELTPDVVKTEKTVAPSQAEKTLIELASYFKPLSVSDKNLEKAAAEYKAQLNEFSDSAAGFINGAIDSRVFTEAPWKQESGVNPQVFNSKTTAQLRTELNQIKNLYYTPQNSSLYISGNITDSSALALTEKYFGRSSRILSQSNSVSPALQSQDSKNEVRRYVLTDDELSSDLTQVVLQYTDFTSDQADLLSAVFNSYSSEFKRLLLKQKNLAIRAPDYIDASSAQQNDSSRLIIQAICEKSKVNAAVQSELFLQMATEKNRVQEKELAEALKAMHSGFTAVSDNSTLLMKNLAVFNQTNKDYSETLFNKNSRLFSISAPALNAAFEAAKPAVFVLCNSSVYAASAKEFKKAGYIHVTAKDGAWYRQNRYKNLLSEKQNSVQTKNSDQDMALSATRFIAENKAQFSSLKLNNGIEVTLKNIPGAKTCSIALAIDGGELLFAEKDAGLASILVNCLASIIQWQLDSQTETGLVKNPASVTAWTGSQYSLLTVTCSTEDLNACLNTAAASIIFGDITPAMADGISYDLRTQWRIKTGTPDFQLLCSAVRSIYEKPFTNLYADTKDKPVQMEFTDIASAYPIILDCTRFSMVIAGGITDSQQLKETLEASFGTLSTLKETQSIKRKVEKKPLPVKVKKIQLRHQFFTDVSADKAGPRPAVLIPTTDFSDPLLYVLESPDIASTECAIFNALLYSIGERLQKKVSQEQTVKVTAPDSDLPYGQIVVTKIKHTAQTDSLYAQVIEELFSDLENLINKDKAEGIIDLEKDELLAEIENLWVLRELEKTGSSKGTAELIQKGKSAGNPQLYLDMYNTVSSATADDYYLVLKSYFEELPQLRVYSVDSKK